MSFMCPSQHRLCFGNFVERLGQGSMKNIRVPIRVSKSMPIETASPPSSIRISHAAASSCLRHITIIRTTVAVPLESGIGILLRPKKHWQPSIAMTDAQSRASHRGVKRGNECVRVKRLSLDLRPRLRSQHGEPDISLRRKGHQPI
jgi:hypothetical protein